MLGGAKWQVPLRAGIQSVRFTSVPSDIAKLFFDSQKLIVLGDTIGTRKRARLDLPCVGRHGDVSYGCVFGLTRSMADHGRIAILFGKFDGIQGFSERADLVDLNQNRISNALSDPFAKEFDIGYEQVIAHELDLCAQSRGQLLPARPVVFRTAVLDRDDWVLRTKLLIKGNEFIGGFLRAIGFLEYISD